MNLYFAAPNNKPDLSDCLKSGHKNFLFSYHYFKKKITWLKEMREEFKLNFFIDSGAFSAHTQGIDISIDDYIKFLHEFKPELYAGLDNLTSPEKTWENQQIMEAADLKPLPTFHLGAEPIMWLERYIELYDYIALGGMVSSSDTDNWLGKVWSMIWERKPQLKVHGFGQTDYKINLKYPFFSVDSSSQVSGVRFANTYLWSEPKKSIYTTEVWKYLRSKGVDYKKGDPILGDNRTMCTVESCHAFMKMLEHITEIHKTRDFSYLTAQYSMFN